MKNAFISLALISLLACGAEEAAAPALETNAAEPTETTNESNQESGRIYGYRVINTFPHDTTLFTQGLFVANGELYESTGQRGESVLMRHSILGDKPEIRQPFPEEVFGEGSVAVGDKIIAVTWRAGVGYIHDFETLERIGEFPLRGEGWGLTYDGERLILSDGTSRIRFLDPETLQETGSLTVTVNGRAVGYLNELEWIKGEIWANVWKQEVIVRIDPDTGNVTSMVDMRGLSPDTTDPDNVLNGIAWDAESERLFVTGKRWPHIYEIELTEAQ